MKKVLITLMAATLAVGMSVSAFAAGNNYPSYKSTRVSSLGDNLLGETTISGSQIYSDAWMQNGTSCPMIGAYLYLFDSDGTRLKLVSKPMYNTDEANATLSAGLTRGQYVESDSKCRDSAGKNYHAWTGVYK